MKLSKLLVQAIFIALCATACGQPAVPTVSPSPSPTTHIANISEPDIHETNEIAELEFAEGEETANPFCRKTLDENGVPCYEVVLKETGETVFLPMSETVLYLSNTEPSHFEYFTVTYTDGGEEKALEQCALYVNVSGAGDADSDAEGNIGDEQADAADAVSPEPSTEPSGEEG